MGHFRTQTGSKMSRQGQIFIFPNLILDKLRCLDKCVPPSLALFPILTHQNVSKSLESGPFGIHVEFKVFMNKIFKMNVDRPPGMLMQVLLTLLEPRSTLFSLWSHALIYPRLHQKRAAISIVPCGDTDTVGPKCFPECAACRVCSRHCTTC